MAIEFFNVRQLDYAEIKKGQHWIYSTDLNIKHTGDKLKSTDRIDCEIHDIKTLLDNGAVVLILAHKGRFADGDAEDLNFAVPYLSQKLGKEVKYYPDNATMSAVDFANSLKPGEIAIMGNARKNMTEEKNDLGLASQYAKLAGNDGAVAVGGFGKAHRADASNVGILEFLPGYLTRSQIEEMRLLAPWAGKKEGTYSIAILGGVKKEKIKTGLVGFFETYDYIIPGGIVLNTILKCKGYDVADSYITDEGKSFEKNVAPLLANQMAGKIFIPDEVIIAKQINGAFQDSKQIFIKDGVPKGYMIVDYVLSKPGIDALEWCVNQKGRMILAGTPGIFNAGFGNATNKVMEYMNRPGVQGIVLGGDTAAEVKFIGPSSTGGGSALSFVAYGTTEVFEALMKNKVKFK